MSTGPAQSQTPAAAPAPALLRGRDRRIAASAAGSVAAATGTALAGTRHWFPAALARGAALFLGVFTLVNVAGALRAPAFDANLWWLDLRPAPHPLALVCMTAVGLALLAYAVVPAMRSWRRWATLSLVAATVVVAVLDSVRFYRVWGDGVEPRLPLPFTLVVAVVLALVAWAAVRAPAPGRRHLASAAVIVLTAAACVVLFPLAQVFFFGTTDYRRPADVAVVFGAQVHENGAASTSLNDRMTTAIQLYHQHLVHRIVVSGGVGDSGYNEALVMRQMAVAAGVPVGRIVVDSSGVNTDATVADTVPFFGGRGWRRIIAVSQFYHLPRIKLAYERAGWDVLTVPARGSRPIKETPYLVAREVPAFWVYYLRAVF